MSNKRKSRGPSPRCPHTNEKIATLARADDVFTNVDRSYNMGRFPDCDIAGAKNIAEHLGISERHFRSGYLERIGSAMHLHQDKVFGDVADRETKAPLTTIYLTHTTSLAAAKNVIASSTLDERRARARVNFAVNSGQCIKT